MALKWDLKAEREIWASICAPNGMATPEGLRITHPDSLWWFVSIAWGAEWYIREVGESRWLQYRVHGPYLRWLQKQIMEWKASRKAGKVVRWRLGVIISRGMGKTVTSTKAASLWSHLDEPNMSTVIGSEVHDKAKEFLGPIKTVMQGQNPTSWFCWLYGVWYDADREWNSKQCVHAFRRSLAHTEPSFGTFGVDTGITGYHPMQVWWDDPLSKNKMKNNDNWLNSVNTAFEATFPAALTNGMVCLVMTRYHDNDPAGRAFVREGCMSWDGMPPVDGRVKVTPKGLWRVYFLQGRDRRDTSKYERGEPVLPEVWPDEELTDYEERNSDEFSAQIMNDPSVGEHMPLTREQLEDCYMDRSLLFNPDNHRLSGKIPIKYATIHLDTAFSPERETDGDNSVIATVLHDLRDNGIVYLDRVLASPAWRVDQFNTHLVNEMIRLRTLGIRVRAITDEKEPGGKAGSWKLLIEQAIVGAGLRHTDVIQFTRQGTKKVQRIKTAAGYWAEGFMKLLCDYVDGKPTPSTTPGLEETVYEMLTIGKAAFDDRSDALADIWKEEIWTRPIPRGQGNEEGANPMQPGDEALKNFVRLDMTDLRRLYDEQNPNIAPIGEYEDNYMPDRY